MDKDITKYLKYYLGQARVRHRYVDYEQGVWTVWEKLTIDHYSRLLNDLSIDGIQLELRKLESMTEEELRGWIDLALHLSGENMDEDTIYKYLQPALDDIHKRGLAAFAIDEESIPQLPHLFHYLLSRGFDLFNLIESGAAINKEQQ